MNLLNVGPWELTVILIIAILVVGPKRMVEIARTIGRVTNQLRRLSAEFTSSLQSEIMAAEREAKQVRDDTVESLTSLTEPFVSLQAELQATEHETRQALESIATGRPEPVESTQAETQATAPETDPALENTQNHIGDKPSQEAQ